MLMAAFRPREPHPHLETLRDEIRAARARRRRAWARGLIALAAALALLAAAAQPLGKALSGLVPDELTFNWGITPPDSLELIEAHTEAGFSGDGYRIKVYASTDSAALVGTFFDVAAMSPSPLTRDEEELVNTVNDALHPTRRVSPPHPGLRKRVIEKDWANTLLCLFDPGSQLLYVYEEHI